MEVVDSVELGDAYATYPTHQGWDLIEVSKCGPTIDRYLGGTLDRSGPFRTGLIRPLPKSWDEGERLVWCGLQGRTPDAQDRTTSAPFVGRVPHGPPATVAAS
jgi:hypothetical protein